MNHKKMTKLVHANAVAKRFWENHDLDKTLMLIIGEISEGIEADRIEKHANIEAYKEALHTGVSKKEAFEKYIKDSRGDEIADSVIRIYDLAGGYDYVLCEDPFFYSNSKNWFSVAKKCCKNLCFIEAGDDRNEDYLNKAFNDLWYISKLLEIDLEWHIREKIEYNATREPLHGKKY